MKGWTGGSHSLYSTADRQTNAEENRFNHELKSVDLDDKVHDGIMTMP
jgi:hypothetical protein